MKVEQYLKNPLHPITVNLIGVGGTGSLVLPRLARMDYALKLLDHPGLMVFSYDNDIVEEYNVGRQNFSDCDLGINKAIAITEKCNLSYGLLWEAHAKKFKPSEKNMANITIICVDNVKFRKEYYQWMNNSVKSREPYLKNYYTIDGGNGKDFGQCVLSSSEKSELKNPFELFPDIEDQDNEEHQGIQGCSYADSLERQDLFINDQIALCIMTTFWKLLREPEIKHNAIMVNQFKNKQLPILL